MKFLKQILLSLVFLVFSISVFAQGGDVFTANADLSKQVESFISAKTTENKEEVKKFTDKLQTGVFPQAQLENIVSLMNLYVKKRANPAPHMVNLIKTIGAFWAKNRSNDFASWHAYLTKMMGQQNLPVSRINEVVVFTYNLLAYNSLEMIGNKNWYLSSSNYKMNFLLSDNGEDIITVTSEGTDLRCREKDDSTLVIYSTTGVYDAKNHVWKGKKGRVDWRRGNLSPDSIYAELSDYTIDTKGDHYSADNIIFYNKKFFKTGLKGSLEDKVVLAGTGEKARYPQFKGSEYDLELPNFIDGVDYRGGYSQSGVIFTGTALNDSVGLAHLIFKRAGKPFIDAATSNVVFGSSKLESKSVRITINIADTVIEHPGVRLKYNGETGELVLYKFNAHGLEEAKYTDYYHRLFIDVNQIEWQREDTMLFFATRPAAPVDYALFQSIDYFSPAEYNEMQGRAAMHPLILLKKYWAEELQGNISAYSMKSLQKFIMTTTGTTLAETQVHQILLRLSFGGFIEYDTKTKTIYRFNQKLFDWISMNTGDRDYSDISMQSSCGRDCINAELNLNDNKLTIYNVAKVDLSQRRRVRILPDSAITVSRNLYVDFRGKVQAGLVDVYGKDFNFDYTKFMLNINKADSMAILSVGKTQDGKKAKIDSVRSVLEHIVGFINIDRPNNKSGYNKKIKTPDNFYPMLTTTDTSYVYYDRLVSKYYERDIFHMTIYPFKLDSLNSIQLSSIKEKAKGEFVSGIFPVLKVPLTVQPDLSLGFVRETSKEGMNLFNGKAVFYSLIALNARGLNGDGDIHYLTSVAKSKQFIFYPDSVYGDCFSVNIKGVKASEIGQIKDVKTEYPNVYSDTVELYWKPHDDIFSVVTQDMPLKLYDKSVAFYGKLDLMPIKMEAQGEMLLNGDGLFSDYFSLKNITFSADSAVLCNFDEKRPDDNMGHFYTDRYNASYDLAAKYAQFISCNDWAKFVYFPNHKYKQRTDFFRYDLAGHSFEFGKDLRHYDKKLIVNTEAELDQLKLKNPNPSMKPLVTGVTFVSYKDTLMFPAQSSSFENANDVIHVNEPGIIEVVDSKIDPIGIININKGGDIDRFENALITANFDSLYHKIMNTSVKIRDKYYFKAKGGQYEYVNESKDVSFLNLDSLEVRLIKLDTAASAPKVRVSFGIGSIGQEENFMLSKQYAFSGKYSFMGLTKGITFNGFAYIRQNCDTTVMPFKFEGNLDPDHIIFPISERVMDTAKNRLYTGFFFNEESKKLYSVFMGKKHNAEDVAVLTANRGLDYLVDKNLYEVAPPKRLADPFVNENYVAFLQRNCNIVGEGSINPNINVDPLQVVLKGFITDDRDLKTVSLDVISTVNFVIKQDFVKMMADDILGGESLTPVDLTDSIVQRKLGMLCGRDTLSRIMKDYTSTGVISKIPASLSKTFVFTHLSLKYDTLYHSYRSLGRIGVAYIGEKAVNRFMEGKVEIISNKKKGDQITIYLEPERGKWYYFNYSMGMLYCLSSNAEFNDKIVNMKEKDRSMKLKGVDYQYLVANDEAKIKFVRSFSNAAPVPVDNDLDDFEKNIESENQGGDETEVKSEEKTSEPTEPQQPQQPVKEEEEEQDFIDE
ncbi:MAG: hypothetical protein II956_00605 [Bacteroidales bacterium]|nr:hypothetical protein [Bacteroidales bacterium]